MRTALLTAAMLTLPAFAGEPTAPSHATTQLEGTYQLIAKPDLESGIDLATEGLPFFTKPEAKARLASVNPAYRKVALHQKDGVVLIQFDGRKAVEVPLKGGLAWTREDGETFWVTAVSSPDRLQQTYKAKDGERTNEFVLTPSGDLLLKVTVRSHRLGHLLRYQMLYRRQA